MAEDARDSNITLDPPGEGGKNYARLIAVGRSMAGRVFPLLHRTAIVGRDEDVDIFIDAVDLSRRHARVRCDDDGNWTIEDLSSRNGTLVNGDPVLENAPRRLTFGDRLQLAESTLLIFSRYDVVEEKLIELQKMDAVGQLASAVAHDFRNLISALQNNLDYIAGELRSPTPDMSEVLLCVGETQQAAKRANELTNRLLGVGRRAEHSAARFDLIEVVDEVLALVGRGLPRDVIIETEIADELSLLGDRTELHQLMLNLCLNGRDAMPNGGTLTVRAMREEPYGGPRRALLADDEAVACIEVEDTGLGMSERTRSRIFEPFFSTKGQLGTGLGLATVNNVVQRHGGDIEVETEVGVGTTFRVRLPLRDRAPALETSFKPPLLPERLESREGQALLLVDDDPLVLSSTRRLLERWGYDVHCAPGGREAVTVFERIRKQLGCAIIDIAMPDLDGRSLLRILRAIDPKIRVIVTSGQVAEGEATPLLTRRDAYVPKPHDQRLREAVERVLRGTRTGELQPTDDMRS